ncbi:MAG: HK97 gp10 family phage protein [Nitrospiraceae bacterium]|nr:HK97 gp10 family phage protein [Nitrospiraceae bacterium]
MIRIEVSITPDLKSLMMSIRRNIQGGIHAGVYSLAEEIEGKAKKEAPVRTSNLANSITFYLSNMGMQATVKATAPYAKYVHQGTGIYGPHGTPIVPVNKKALFWPGAKHPVKSVKGMKANPFFTRAIEQTDAQGVFERAISNYLRSKGD